MYLRALPSNVTETSGTLFISRGVTKIKFAKNDFQISIHELLSLLKQPYTESEILKKFEPSLHPEIQDIITALLKANILVQSKIACDIETANSENPDDIFYWHFKTKKESISQILSPLRLAILGVNSFSTILFNLLKKSGFVNIFLMNDPILDEPLCVNSHKTVGNIDLKNDIDGIVALAPFNQRNRLSLWNKKCLTNNTYFFPILVDNLHVYIGPHVTSNKSACFDCSIKRYDSHLIDNNLTSTQATHPHSLNEDKQINGYHISMAYASASFICMELIKYFTKFSPVLENQVTDLSIVNQQAITSKVTKIPFCSSCGN